MHLHIRKACDLQNLSAKCDPMRPIAVMTFQMRSRLDLLRHIAAGLTDLEIAPVHGETAREHSARGATVFLEASRGSLPVW